ncbi:adenosylcobinamide-phosphate synthase CbiB [Amphibiibacter pelophylacis]|uniref:Adenosylcobinamide-phosphate synthase CbiB n=1 Tax=Amphibiibacter pelophylacis TaxID=1799477 RepID=A0ACC6P2R6_9BURK
MLLLSWLLGEQGLTHLRLGLGFLDGLLLGVVAALALLLAWALDALGEPPNRWHPVAWFGHAAAGVGRRLHGDRATVRSPIRQRLLGALAWWALVLPPTLLAAALQIGLMQALLGAARNGVSPAAALAWMAGTALVLALLIKPTLAWRSLRDHVQQVETALAPSQDDSLSQGRQALAHIVSRDVTQLDAPQVRASALQSLSENLNDAWVAPLLWLALLGLPGAVLYRCANTLDAMWGYRDHRLHSGAWAARSDDVLSWLPARLTAVLIAPRIVLRRWPALRREADRTPSPNGGWPMGALALALDVRLEKPGSYTLNPEAAPPQPADTARAIARCQRAAQAAAALALAAQIVLVVSGLPGTVSTVFQTPPGVEQAAPR